MFDNINLSGLLSPWIVKPIDSYLDSLIKHGVRRKYQANSVLFREGEYPSSLFCLLTGKVKLSICYPHGSELLVAVHETQNLFGASALDGNSYFVTATAIVDSEVVAFSIDKIKQIIKDDPKVALCIIRSLGAESRQLAGQVSSIALTDASARVVRLLSIFSATSISSRRKYLSCTHHDIANATGLSRASVTAILNTLERGGIISKSRSMITVLDINKLQSLLDVKSNIRTRAVDKIEKKQV